MNKSKLITEIIQQLETAYQKAVAAADQARDTATDAENIAENKYDTLGLEAAYLAHGQSQRAAELKADLNAFNSLTTANCNIEDEITVGTLIVLTDINDDMLYLFLGPAAGGLKVKYHNQEFLVISPSAPLGSALSGHYVNDEIVLTLAGITQHFDVTAIY
ncbi:MAG: GreA/GreB family elongation factor [Pseudomonadales bacterium]|nr:GreA/GreB family elongation factor [Pseudomonadales bacterium]